MFIMACYLKVASKFVPPPPYLWGVFKRVRRICNKMLSNISEIKVRLV